MSIDEKIIKKMEEFIEQAIEELIELDDIKKDPNFLYVTNEDEWNQQKRDWHERLSHCRQVIDGTMTIERFKRIYPGTII
jgi:hypothetical protein